MFVATVLVFFFALFFSVLAFVKLAEFIVRVSLTGSGEMKFLHIFLPALGWTAFYCLINW
jgi:hypothetical protein